MIELRDYQKQAIQKLKTGCILNGGVGSGKSRTALAYYYIQYGGDPDSTEYTKMQNPPDLYVITTAKKRDDMEWESEMTPFLLYPDGYPDKTPYKHKVVIDSWNNIQKYKDVKRAFFIFDEDRVTGKGAWVKAFLKITEVNEWIILSATPGDKWEDYIPVFIANGYYRNRTEFNRYHCVFAGYTKFPKIDHYINTGKLVRLRNNILVNMDFDRETVANHIDIWFEYNIPKYKQIIRERWNPWKDEPITNASDFCYCLRRVVNEDESREAWVLEAFEKHPRIIIFYNFDYELEKLRSIGETLTELEDGFEYAEWNGHKHQEVPTGEKWMYFVQYNAGCEGWNCVYTDTIIFYSQNYSYKMTHQAAGRIDRLNTPYTNLYYYHLKSRSGIDLAIARALKDKKKFNERRFYEG